MQENQKGPISPNRQRAMNFLHSLGRRLGRRQYNDLIYSSEEDLRISSSERCCSTLKTNIKDYHSSSFDLSSEASSESSSNSECTADTKRTNVKNNHRSRLSISSFSKALQNLSPSSKSSSSSSTSSCNSTPLKQTNSSKAKNQPQRILRQPVHYVYLKGMSGLPTRRVPRSSICCQYANR